MLLRISSSSSGAKSSHCSKDVKNFVSEFDKTTIKTCVIGISKMILLSTKTFTHAALFLSDKDATKFDKYDSDYIEGIIIEYGGYDPYFISDEKDAVNNGYVIYRYGKDNGGLRYYINKFSEFKKKLGDIIYMALEIKSYNQVSFSYFLEKIAPEYGRDWVKEKYKLNDYNCRTFVAKAIEEIKPVYDKRLIQKGDKTIGEARTKEEYIPKEILASLNNYYF